MTPIYNPSKNYRISRNHSREKTAFSKQTMILHKYEINTVFQKSNTHTNSHKFLHIPHHHVRHVALGS